jgi:hypothetical protein
MNTIVASSSATNDVQQTPTDSARPEAATSTDAPRGKQPAAGSSLRDERLLLERATAALVRGDSASALATLREHSRRFPRGGLAEEREVLFIRALRASGDEAAAQQRTERFKGEFPSSLQRGIIDAPASK